MREQGFANAELAGGNGHLAQSRTPEAALARLHAQLAARHPALAARIAELGAEAGGNRPAEFGAMVHAQVAGVRPLVRELRMQIE